MNKVYRCECGREFSNSQQANGHKNHCKIHLEAVGKSDVIEKHNNSISVSMKKYHERHKKELLERKKEETIVWTRENHKCIKCGKLMTEKYGTGIYCSSSCAHSHSHTDNWKQNISLMMQKLYDPSLSQTSAKEAGKRRRAKNEANYYSNPCICKVCGKTLPYDIRNRKTCSQECFQKQNGGFREGSVKNHKHGVYRGIHCDSSWELAFVVYNIEHGISISRNNQYFLYLYNDKQHKYYPDFIVDDTYVEIKNYWTEQVQAKIDQFPKDKKYKILYWNDVKSCIDYCIKKYGKYYWKTLYE